MRTGNIKFFPSVCIAASLPKSSLPTLEGSLDVRVQILEASETPDLNRKDDASPRNMATLISRMAVCWELEGVLETRRGYITRNSPCSTVDSDPRRAPDTGLPLARENTVKTGDVPGEVV